MFDSDEPIPVTILNRISGPECGPSQEDHVGDVLECEEGTFMLVELLPNGSWQAEDIHAVGTDGQYRFITF